MSENAPVKNKKHGPIDFREQHPVARQAMHSMIFGDEEAERLMGKTFMAVRALSIREVFEASKVLGLADVSLEDVEVMLAAGRLGFDVDGALRALGEEAVDSPVAQGVPQ